MPHESVARVLPPLDGRAPNGLPEPRTARRRPPVRARVAQREGAPEHPWTPSTPAVELAPPRRRLPFQLGRYALLDQVGKGGMADIYLALTHTELGGERLVVVKELLAELASEQRFVDLLVSEAKLASQLSHRNIVSVEELGRHDGSLFVTMEYVEGLDLREVLKRCASRGIPVPIELSLLVVRELLGGLDYAHRFGGGVLHRDVSPSNVLVSLEGEVRLCDFGIARALDAAEGALPAESICGKAGYMSPEQARGQALDVRSDVFGAGVIAWELLAGRRLYRAKPGPALLELAREASIPPLPERGLPHEAALHALVARVLSPTPSLRPTAAGFRSELDRWLARAGLAVSPLRLQSWMMEHFGAEIIERRASRVRAHRALSRGPAAVIVPITSANEHAGLASAADAALELAEPVALFAAPSASPEVSVPPATGLELAASEPAARRASPHPLAAPARSAPAGAPVAPSVRARARVGSASAPACPSRVANLARPRSAPLSAPRRKARRARDGATFAIAAVSMVAIAAALLVAIFASGA